MSDPAVNEAPLLAMRSVSKRFPGVVALEGVGLELNRGEVLALVGENGAGKSTLMKILGGVHLPDDGEIIFDGNRVTINDVARAKALGIGLIHQELMLAPNLDIAGNIFLGAEHSSWGFLARLNHTGMARAAEGLLRRVGLDLAPSTPLKQLTTGQMQLVEIARALAMNARVIIMDEPTSSLTLSECEKLFKIVGELKASGISVIYISHRLDEILRICDRITVLRDGRRVGDLSARGTTRDQIVNTMVGRELSDWFPTREKNPGEVLLEVDSLVVPGSRGGVSFQARRGEILGFAGLVGSGRTELMQVIFGVDQALGGCIRLEGRPFSPHSPADAIRKGIYLAPEDRKLHGLVLSMGLDRNISLPDIANYRPRWWLQRGQERRVAREQVTRLGIKTPGIHQRVANLSGGNQQKAVLGKWLAMSPTILILDEPTRGIDVGAKAEIYRQIAQLADQGLTILMVSSEMEEIMGMSDRVIVLGERRITGVLERRELSEAKILSLMTGREKVA